MKSFTIHKLDVQTAASLEALAQQEHTSVNRLVKKLLRQTLGLQDSEQIDHRAEFEDLFGTWSKQESQVFEKAMTEFETVNKADWED